MDEFTTRVERGVYEINFKTDDHNNYIAVQKLCMKLIDHEKPDETTYRQNKNIKPWSWLCNKCGYEQAQTLYFPNYCPRCGRIITHIEWKEGETG